MDSTGDARGSIDDALATSQQAHLSGFHLIVERGDATSVFANRPGGFGLGRVPFLIGVAGGTASGKTTVCDQIIQSLHDHRVVLIHQDSFYRGLTEEEVKQVGDYNFDHPDAFDSDAIVETLLALKRGEAVEVPVYDFTQHRRAKETWKVNPGDVVILEGILVFHDLRIREQLNMKVFVDTDADVRLARRIQRDTVERGRSVESVITQYARFVKPAFDDFVLPTKKFADVIIPRGGDNHVAVDLIVQHIRAKLGQHDLRKIYQNVHVIDSTFQIRGMHTLIRDRNTKKHDFVFYADRLIRLVVEHGLGHLPFTEKQVVTPTGSTYVGVDFCSRLCGVSIIRSGESMENALRACCKGIKIGKILIHREGDYGKQLIYEKLPRDITNRHVMLLDPILASGNSAIKAIETLIRSGVTQEKIIFLNLISSPEGIHAVCQKYPRLKIVTSEIDDGVNENYLVVPGVGEFGDRYFGTDEEDDESDEGEDGVVGQGRAEGDAVAQGRAEGDAVGQGRGEGDARAQGRGADGRQGQGLTTLGNGVELLQMRDSSAKNMNSRVASDGSAAESTHSRGARDEPGESVLSGSGAAGPPEANGHLGTPQGLAKGTHAESS